jgi:hypothetical protein
MKFSARSPLSRRDLLQSLGAAALGLPFLEAIGSPAQAQMAGSFAKFAVFIYQPNGVFQDSFWPTGGETDFVLSDVLSPLEPFREQLLLLGPELDASNKPLADTGLTYAKAPPQHRAPVCLTANVTSIDLSLTKEAEQNESTVNDYSDGTSSIDQLIGQRVQGDAPFHSLNFGCHPFGGDTVSDINFLDGVAQKRMWTADEAWQRVFGNFVDPGGDPAAVSQAQAALRRQAAVTNFLHARFQGLHGSVGKADREALDQHLSSLRAVETRKQGFLQAVVDQELATCEKPEQRQVPADEESIRTGADTEQLLPLFIDITSAAFSCGLSRVASLTLSYPGGGGEGGARMPWLGFTNAIHGVSHHNGQQANVDKYNAMVKWWATQVAYLMQRLAGVPYEGGTLLDHTTIYWFNRHGEGNAHTNFALPNLILGGTGGYFRMGRFLKLPRSSPTQVLVSLAHSMGLEDLEEFGKAELLATGPLPGLR